MQHVEECDGCATYWEELQAAQDLVLRLPVQGVRHDFRDRLWARIQAGEGTPEAVFRDPVPTLTKVRYALTGAAAAAAVLLAAVWLRDERRVEPADVMLDRVASDSSAGNTGLRTDGGALSPRIRIGGAPAPQQIQPQAQLAAGVFGMVSAAQPLTADLVAVEAAKQFEQRLSNANWAIRRLRSEPENNAMLRQAFDNANELRAFGSLLLTLRDRERLFFRDTNVDADLRVAVKMLDEKRLQKRNLDTVRNVVAPALSSEHLDNLVNMIAVQPSVDPREEFDVVLRLNMPPEVFAQMFHVMGNSNEATTSFGTRLPGGVFLFQSDCGPQFVAPRSR